MMQHRFSQTGFTCLALIGASRAAMISRDTSHLTLGEIPHLAFKGENVVLFAMYGDSRMGHPAPSWSLLSPETMAVKNLYLTPLMFVANLINMLSLSSSPSSNLLSVPLT
ncbi:hypothetical protein BKA70DRAFT_659845 [Coprinopsis sp. MPI-PUGE-AT-0042]|nr:hypothetical protein BKA70DRAFT_659845 [Coprinopsis sp. MPI-PUGE-AT-0042]